LLAANSISQSLIECKNTMLAVLQDRKISTSLKNRTRNFGKEVFDSERLTHAGKVRVTGGEVSVPLVFKSRTLIYKKAEPSRVFLRTQEATKSFLLRLYQIKSSSAVFAVFEPISGIEDFQSTSATISGRVQCFKNRIFFEGQDMALIDYQVGDNQFIPSKSSYALDWTFLGQETLEKAQIETRAFDGLSLQEVGSIGEGWHD